MQLEKKKNVIALSAIPSAEASFAWGGCVHPSVAPLPGLSLT